jgi:hypothetical protein
MDDGTNPQLEPWNSDPLLNPVLQLPPNAGSWRYCKPIQKICHA